MRALWMVRLPLYAAGFATGGAFSVLFTGGSLPYLLGAALIALLLGSAGGYRFVMLLPATALYTLVAVYGVPPLTPGGWRSLINQIGRDVRAATEVAYTNPVPYDVHPGFLLVLLPIVMIVVAFATSATLYEESPMISFAVLGLTVCFLSTVSFEVGIAPFFAALLVSGIAFLLLSNGGAGRSGGYLRPSAVLAGALVALSVLALPFVPLAGEVIRPALVDWTRVGDGNNSRMSVEADVGDYLKQGRDTELLKIKSPEPLLWRGGTLDRFDGARWSSTTRPGEDDGDEVSSGVPTREVTQGVEVLDAQTNLLFGGYHVSGVSVPSAQERSDGSWASPRPLEKGSTYRVVSEIPQPTLDQLETTGTGYPAAVREKFLQLPEDRPGVLDRTAEEIRANYAPTTPYDTARAIERYLIHDGGFKYNINASYDRADRAIEEFLGGNKEGFCTQFATSMALLTRELGIPSRVVYGATTGNRVAPGEYVVNGYNVHTWVEVYFPGVGWYPFDPTPGFSVPDTMEVNAPRPDLPTAKPSQVPSPEQLQPSQPISKAAEQSQSSAGASDSSDQETPGGEVPYRYVLPPILLLSFLAGVPLLKRLLAARGRPEDLYEDVASRLRDVLPPGRSAVADSPALTPTERLVLLAGAAGVEEGPFRELARAYSESLYAPYRSGRSVMRAHHEAVREYERLPRWRRTLGAVNPASLSSTSRRALAASWIRLRKALPRAAARTVRSWRGSR